MEVKNLSELFNEFKKYRETKKNVANEENFYDYVQITTSSDLVHDWPGYTDLNSIYLVLGENKYPKKAEIFIDINISPLKNSKSENKFFIHDAWIEREENVLKILQDIWTTGEIKDTYGLDLNWPANQQTSEISEKKQQAINTEPQPKQSNQKSIELEKKIQELQIKNKQLKEEKKLYWIVGSLVLVSLGGLIVWLIFRRKDKNRK